MTEYESRMEAIKLKMDTLGQMMYDWEAKQRQFEEEHREELTEIAVRKEELRDEVVRLGTSVESEKLKVGYRKGRVSWNNTALEGYAKAHPELLAFRKEGQPSVAFSLKVDEPIWLESQQASW